MSKKKPDITGDTVLDRYVSVEDEQASKKTSLGSILMKIITYPLFVVFLLVAIIWFLAHPNGELRMALDPNIQDDNSKTKIAFSLFQLADANC